MMLSCGRRFESHTFRYSNSNASAVGPLTQQHRYYPVGTVLFLRLLRLLLLIVASIRPGSNIKLEAYAFRLLGQKSINKRATDLMRAFENVSGN